MLSVTYTFQQYNIKIITQLILKYNNVHIEVKMVLNSLTNTVPKKLGI